MGLNEAYSVIVLEKRTGHRKIRWPDH